MRELSLHVLDIVQNSLAAGATEIEILVAEWIHKNQLRIAVVDNGRGIAAEKLERVLDPFYTSRRTRKVGLGLSLFQAAAVRCGGDFRVDSQPDRGTTVTAVFQYDHLDRAPLGNIADTLVTLIVCNPEIRFRYRHEVNQKSFQFDSGELTRLTGGEAVSLPQMADRLKKYLQHEIECLSLI